jgi:hypothetical protein
MKKLEIKKSLSIFLFRNKLDYNGEKKGPQNFPYVGVKEEILRTKKKIGK